MPKLKRVKKNQLNYKNISISLALVIGLMTVFGVYKSYAIYKLEKKYDLIQSKIGKYTMGNVRVVALVDGKETIEFPSYETNYKVEGVECTNGVTASFDVENWQLNIDDMSVASAKCTVSFDSTKTNSIIPIVYSKKKMVALNAEVSTVAAALIIDKIYPVGSIYMSTSDDTVEKVQNKFGGTWVKYSGGTTLVGDDGTNYITNDETKGSGGSSNVVLTNENLPEHSHIIPALSGTATGGNHKHAENAEVWANTGSSDPYYISPGSTWYFNTGSLGKRSTIYTGNSGNLSLSVATTESNTTTCTNCISTPVNVQNPYTVVYMYKRIA